jgi:cytosine/adenosine deaminase-related metal-dependent hydrolase
MRAVVYAEIFGGSGGTTAQDRFESALALVEKYNDESSDRLRVGLGPLAPYLISRHVLKIASQHAQHMGIPIQIHAAESFAEMEFFYDSKGPIADVLLPRSAGANTPSTASSRRETVLHETVS